MTGDRFTPAERRSSDIGTAEYRAVPKSGTAVGEATKGRGPPRRPSRCQAASQAGRRDAPATTLTTSSSESPPRPAPAGLPTAQWVAPASSCPQAAQLAQSPGTKEEHVRALPLGSCPLEFGRTRDNYGTTWPVWAHLPLVRVRGGWQLGESVDK